MEGCETAQTVLDRYLPALRRVAREHDGQTVAVFSHGAAMRIVLGTLQGLPLAEIGQSPHGDNTAVSLIEAQGPLHLRQADLVENQGHGGAWPAVSPGQP